MGYGTHDGRYLRGYAEGIYVDIMNERGELVTQTAQYQISPVPELTIDLDNVVNRDDQQLQTVGHHLPLDGPEIRHAKTISCQGTRNRKKSSESAADNRCQYGL